MADAMRAGRVRGLMDKLSPTPAADADERGGGDGAAGSQVEPDQVTVGGPSTAATLPKPPKAGAAPGGGLKKPPRVGAPGKKAQAAEGPEGSKAADMEFSQASKPIQAGPN